MSHYQTIYNRLRRSGLTEAGALGFLGNWQCESGCEPNRLQNDFNSFRRASKDYTAGVMNGSISRYTFGSDQKGYGLAQWTYVNDAKDAGRKYNLYDFWKRSGKALDDVNMQVDFCLWEMKSGGYAHVWPIVTQNNDLYTCVDKICRLYEQPAKNNVGARFEAANSIKYQINLAEWEQEAAPVTEPAPASDPAPETPAEPESLDFRPELIPATEFWPCRGMKGGASDPGMCSGMNGADVEVLQAILKARGFLQTNPDGIFGSFLETTVKQFQTAYKLQPDGVVGPLTWGKLLERG